MKNAATRVRTTMTVGAIVLATGLTSGVTRANDGSCAAATLSGESQADQTGAFVGRGTLTLGGQSVAVNWVSVITSATTNPDGTLSLGSSHHVTSAVGNSIDFTTSDQVSAVPTSTAGVYTFASHLVIQSGQGRVHSGVLDVLGHVDLVHGHVRIDSSSGDLCAAP